MFGWLFGVGKFLARVIGIVRDAVPEPVLRFAIDKATEAAVKFATNDERREWLVQELMDKTGISESVARLAVELAIQYLKKHAA